MSDAGEPATLADVVRRVCAISTLSFFTFVTATSACAEQFSFRGIPLGISVSEFRKVPFPDREKYPQTRVICSTDKDQAAAYPKISVNDRLRQAGVTACSYYTRSKNTPFESPSAPDLANIGGWDTVFYFTPSSAAEPLRQRLYLIEIKPSAEHFQRIVNALETRYGPPQIATSETWRNGLGGEFPNEKRTWYRDGTSVKIYRLGDRIDQSMVSFEHWTAC